MLRKRILPLITLLISIASPLFAQTASAPSTNEMAAENSSAYRIYEVQKGDTLWGISRKFIVDPYYWPDLWANNPDIQNPHFIYPGEKLRIYSGPIVVVGVEEDVAEPVIEEMSPLTSPPLAPVLVEEAPVVAPEPQITITVPAGVSFISESEQRSGGTIIDFPLARYFAATGDTVLVRLPVQGSVSVGERMEILKSNTEIIHPVSKKRLGFQVDQLGVLEITALGKDLQTAIIRKNFREIERGAWVTPLRSSREKISLCRAERELKGMVVGTASHKELQGPNEVLFLDLGEKLGLKVGNVLTMTRPGQATDLVQVKDKRDEGLVYPEVLIGYALVVETNQETATAVILKSLLPSVIGDLVRTQTGPLTP